MPGQVDTPRDGGDDVAAAPDAAHCTASGDAVGATRSNPVADGAAVWRCGVSIARPRTVDDAVGALAERPEAELLAGGTDLMVGVNLGHRRPEGIVALRRVAELRGHRVHPGDDGGGDVLELGALLTYTAMEHDLDELAPGLAMAARTVGSPQIRNAGTVGGNVGTASPAGDTLPWLLALDAEVVLASRDGVRVVPLAEHIVGPKRTGLRPGELVTAVRVPLVTGPQHVAKIGPRNAMVISIASLAIILDTTNRQVRVGLGSVGPVPLRPTAAEALATAAVDWDALTCADDDVEAFAAACAEAAAPISDHRSTAEYRRHAIGVLAGRALRRCLT
jgi:CO/xanthine dehydrogenase FAD-binding subunit